MFVIYTVQNKIMTESIEDVVDRSKEVLLILGFLKMVG